MIRLSAPPALRLSLNQALRGAGLVAGLALSLAGCESGEAIAATPGGQALIASQPAVSSTQVPPPPAIAGIVGSPAAPASAADPQELARANAQLDSAFANASACTADTDCRAVGVGSRACGGPTGYRAYSIKSTDPASMEALVQRQRELSAAAERAAHRFSPCYMLANPGARCEQNKCVTGRPGAN